VHNFPKDDPSLAEILLDEFTHRINNELAGLIALVTREQSMHHDHATAGVLKRVHARLVNVGRVQHALQGPRAGMYSDVADYLRDLCRNVSRTCDGVDVHFTGTALRLDPDRSRRVGMIVSELIENARKHAFAGGRGSVWVDLSTRDGKIECRISDNGRGLSGARPGRGLSIVNALARSLNGSIVSEPAEIGTTWLLTVPTTH